MNVMLDATETRAVPLPYGRRVRVTWSPRLRAWSLCVPDGQLLGHTYGPLYLEGVTFHVNHEGRQVMRQMGKYMPHAYVDGTVIDPVVFIGRDIQYANYDLWGDPHWSVEAALRVRLVADEQRVDYHEVLAVPYIELTQESQ